MVVCTEGVGDPLARASSRASRYLARPGAHAALGAALGAAAAGAGSVDCTALGCVVVRPRSYDQARSTARGRPAAAATPAGQRQQSAASGRRRGGARPSTTARPCDDADDMREDEPVNSVWFGLGTECL